MPAHLAALLLDVRRALEQAFGERLVRLAVFGSWARGEADEDSDVDVLVLLDAVTFAERARAIDLAAQAGLDAGDWVVAPLVLSSAEWAELVRRERSLVREIERDGVAA